MQLPKGSGLEALDRITRRSLQYYTDLLKSDRFQQGQFFPTIPTIPAINIQSIRQRLKEAGGITYKRSKQCSFTNNRQT